MKILFVHNSLSSFVKTDLQILSSEHKVRNLDFSHHPRKLASSLWQTYQGVVWADVVFSWFGGFHALLPFILGKCFRRTCIVVASGYDVANLPEIQYGNMRPGFMRYVGKTIFALADRILAVSNYSAEELLRNVGVDADKVEVIQHGFESAAVAKMQDKTNRVVTIARISWLDLKLKGLETFIQSAAQLPDAEFVIIGQVLDDSIETLCKSAPPNVKFAGFVKDAGSSAYLKTAKVYTQLSYFESFGYGLGEAMLQGCIPVVTCRGALPELVGDTGFIVPYGDIEATKNAFQQALSTETGYGLRAQARIQEHFPLEKRRHLLLEAVNIGKSPGEPI